MTLDGVMAVTLRYFTEFGKAVFRLITASICGGIYGRVYCILKYVYNVVVKKVHVRYLTFVSSGLLCNIVAAYLTSVQFILQLKPCLHTIVHLL